MKTREELLREQAIEQMKEYKEQLDGLAARLTELEEVVGKARSELEFLGEFMRLTAPDLYPPPKVEADR